MPPTVEIDEESFIGSRLFPFDSLSFTVHTHRAPALGRSMCMEQATGIEPAFQAWEARILTIELCLHDLADNILFPGSCKLKNFFIKQMLFSQSKRS